MLKFKDTINKQIDLWEQEEINNSCPLDQNNKRIKYLMSFKNSSYKKRIIIKTILERIKKEPSWIIILLDILISDKKQPKISSRDIGKIKKVTRIWMKWGREKGYI